MEMISAKIHANKKIFYVKKGIYSKKFLLNISYLSKEGNKGSIFSNINIHRNLEDDVYP